MIKSVIRSCFYFQLFIYLLLLLFFFYLLSQSKLILLYCSCRVKEREIQIEQQICEVSNLKKEIARLKEELDNQKAKNNVSSLLQHSLKLHLFITVILIDLHGYDFRTSISK